MKKFEKKMRFDASALKYMAGQSSQHSDSINQRAELAQHILDCHAEIDRLNDEIRFIKLDALTSPEREWISSETHGTFPERGVWFWWNKSTDEVGARDACAGDYLSPLCDYTLILAEADFPVPPKPSLEVKVGKYHWGTKGKTCHILDIGQKYCLYRFGGNSQAVLHQPISNMQRMMQEADAIFIGGGDDAE